MLPGSSLKWCGCGGGDEVAAAVMQGGEGGGGEVVMEERRRRRRRGGGRERGGREEDDDEDEEIGGYWCTYEEAFMGLGWNNMRYIIETALLHGQLLNRTVITPSFVYAAIQEEEERWQWCKEEEAVNDERKYAPLENYIQALGVCTSSPAGFCHISSCTVAQTQNHSWLTNRLVVTLRAGRLGWLAGCWLRCEVAVVTVKRVVNFAIVKRPVMNKWGVVFWWSIFISDDDTVLRANTVTQERYVSPRTSQTMLQWFYRLKCEYTALDITEEALATSQALLDQRGRVHQDGGSRTARKAKKKKATAKKQVVATERWGKWEVVQRLATR
ncbi:hypothetical protein SERLADRAFT_411256 [Serpula lacrymans var. lacrymans S7.9]|uniref:Uncharacterized protein n=1 Tax=Serpula lacrymans var. lacrymans (strain S7.9) TaxID=578457 RepID=F8P9S8_SERL9|nr:uncharacterized protein SERLADRAFT_411256 [Serpula lacrymans var. lacrymans S7.9]EGO20407.1 hypothetical protein SERLADRAFT_411256 [Serpula lacrymans var. lacrymans S7.9]